MGCSHGYRSLVPVVLHLYFKLPDQAELCSVAGLVGDLDVGHLGFDWTHGVGNVLDVHVPFVTGRTKETGCPGVHVVQDTVIISKNVVESLGVRGSGNHELQESVTEVRDISLGSSLSESVWDHLETFAVVSLDTDEVVRVYLELG